MDFAACLVEAFGYPAKSKKDSGKVPTQHFEFNKNVKNKKINKFWRISLKL